MPREKQFDVDAALDDAMRIFWAKGYQATSLQDLLDAMGIQRGSLYDTFGDKRSLYLAAIKRYDETERKHTLAWARQGRSPRETVQVLFDALVNEAVQRKKRDGCFLVNTALELAPHDKAMAGVVTDGFEAIERFFAQVLREGQACGEVNVDINVRDVSRMLLAAMIGIRVMSRSWPDKSVLNSIAAQAMKLLD